ncbi:MAG: hypothetical protein Q9228_002631, partial [Teloschistes exilis]
MPRARPTTTKPPTAATKTLTPRRSSTRLIKSSPSHPAIANKTTKTTPKKSQFFTHSTTEETSEAESESEFGDEGSGYEDEDASASLVSASSEDEDVEDVEEEDEDDRGDAGKKKRKRGGRGGAGAGKNGKKMKKITAAAVDNHGNGKEGGKGKELWREGVKSHLAPGEEIFVKLPKARGDGGVKYEAGV